MKRMLVAAGLCLVLGGCSNLYSYKKEGADAERTQADIMACEKELNPYSYTGDEAREAFDKCMASKGYGKKVEKYRL